MSSKVSELNESLSMIVPVPVSLPILRTAVSVFSSSVSSMTGTLTMNSRMPFGIFMKLCSPGLFLSDDLNSIVLLYGLIYGTVLVHNYSPYRIIMHAVEFINSLVLLVLVGMTKARTPE